MSAPYFSFYLDLYKNHYSLFSLLLSFIYLMHFYFIDFSEICDILKVNIFCYLGFIEEIWKNKF